MTSKYDNYFKVGDKHGKWTVVCDKINPSKRHSARILCECSCKRTTKYVLVFDLLHGKANKCRLCSDEVNSASGGLSKNWKGVKDVPHNYFNTIRHHAIGRNIEYNITIEYVADIFEKQNKQCVYTKRVLCFGRKGKIKTETTASLDRINSELGYVVGNVQWVHKEVNLLKSDYTHKEFISLCKEIIDNCASVG